MENKIKFAIQNLNKITLIIIVMALVSCSGGDDPAGVGGPAPAIIGVAATGAPVIGEVTLKDSSSPSIVLKTMTASDGSFKFLTTDLKAPFILRVTVNGKKLYSLSVNKIGVANITPLTTIVSSVSICGDDLDALFDSNPINLASAVAGISNAETQVQRSLAPMLDLYGVKGNLLNSSFKANHAGEDALLDGINVTVSAGPGATISITNKNVSPGTILSASASAICAGTVSPTTVITTNIPTVPVSTLGANLYAANCASCHGDISNSSISGRSSVDLILTAIATDVGGMSKLSGLTTEEIRAINDAIPTSASSPPVGGEALYTANCSSCHGPIATSTKLGATIVRLQNAISSNLGGMGRLSILSAADMQAIILALNSTSTSPTPTPSPTQDGAALYASNCAGCHGPLETSTKKGATVTRFTNAVTTNSSTTGMGYLSSLSIAEVQAIISVLTPVTSTTPATGAELYATYCEGCHGALATSAKAGKNATTIQTAINANTGGMGSLSTLTAQQIADIATALAGITPPSPPVGGSALYDTNCSGCHGLLATSTKAGKSATAIQNAITNNTGGMGYLSTLTPTNITDIAAALATVTPPTTPEGLYTTNCSGCHGLLASSTKGGATATKIQTSININRGGMGYLSTLTPGNISDIALALSTIPPPACGSCHAVTTTKLTTGRHTLHLTSSEVASRFPAANSRCGTCHGIGYTTTTIVSETHNDGTKNVATNATGAIGTTNGKSNSGPINWVPPVLGTDGITVITRGTCTPGCHGKQSW